MVPAHSLEAVLVRELALAHTSPNLSPLWLELFAGREISVVM